MGAFQKSSRRKLFYTLALIFMILVPLVLLYSRGYTIDFRNRGVVPTGGVFVKVAQPDAQIFIDEVLSRETSFITKGALLSGLFPRRYTVRVEKENRQPWVKSLHVVDTEVLEFRNVFLPPATVTPKLVFNARRTPVTIAFLPGRPEIAVVSGGPDAATLFIVDPATSVARFNSSRVSDWSWDVHQQAILITRLLNGKLSWYRLSLEGNGSETPLLFRGLPSGFTPERVQLHPTETGSFYFLANGALFLQGSSNVPLPIAESVHAFLATPKHLYYLTQTGFFVETDLTGGNTRSLGRPGLFLDPAEPAQLTTSPLGDVLILDSAGGFFLFQPDRDVELVPVIGNVHAIDFSEDGSRALLIQDRRLTLLWLRDNPEQPFNIARSRHVVVTTTSPILNAYLNAAGTYAFFSIGDGIRMVETDDRGGANNYRLTDRAVDSFIIDRKFMSLFWSERNFIYSGTLE